MRLVRALLIAVVALAALASCATSAAQSAPPGQDWQAFDHALTLVQTLVNIAARSDSPEASLKGIDDVLAGRDPEANRAIAGLFEDATEATRA